MQFNSYSYLVLLPIIVAMFWALPVAARRPYVLLVSVLFYASWTWMYAPLPFIICGVVYVCARQMRAHPGRARPALWTGVAITIGLLTFFKYGPFIVENVKTVIALFRRSPATATVAVALPLGISFYSFEAISYLLDTRQNRVKKVSFMDLSLFVTFWPHLISGPIVRVRELVPQLDFDEPFDISMLMRGLDRFVYGLVQKNLIANSLAGFVDEGFIPQAAAAHTIVDNWFVALAFGLQIYFDFAAYSNMAIGAAQMVGVRLPENFRFPYHAQNPSDFWSRWHMTLSRWIRDYLFFPITARFQAAPVPLYLSLIGIMAIVGLWHGAGWGFVVWGVMHGLYLVAFRVWEAAGTRRFPGLVKARPVMAGWRILTLLAVTAAWIPFRASTQKQALTMLRGLILTHGFRPSYSINLYLITVMVAGFAWLEPMLADRLQRLEARVPGAARLLWSRPVVYAAGLVLFLIFDDRDTQFIYFQF